MYSTLSKPKGITRTSSGELSWLCVCLSSPITSSVGTETLRLTFALANKKNGLVEAECVGKKTYFSGVCWEETVASEAGFDKTVCCVFPAHSSSLKAGERVLQSKP